MTDRTPGVGAGDGTGAGAGAGDGGGADGVGGSDARRDELTAAALADDLSPSERVEFDALRAADPSIDADLASLGVVVGGLSDLGRWDEVAPSDGLRERVHAVARAGDDPAAGRATDDGIASDVGTASDAGILSGAGTTGDDPTLPRIGPHVATARSGRGRRPLLISVAAAACLAIGAGGGVLLAMPRDTVVAGPAGTLGAVEHVDFVGQPAGVDLDGDLVAHTWGTETVLSIDGLPTGSAFTVVVVGGDGREYESGAFLGSDVRVDCRLNAAVLRPDVASVEIRAADGHDIAVASVPPVAS
ncbi:hypothetical protein IFT36_14140 [Frigoribacterium sp. CFBP 13605]|uniref:hypothetical protein n=1 Tax=Frigoribacterium sp. CFBP 13605 TaxID=2774034 RepID=UPI0019064363|nr:hypothetical protein [Frigoribacterium sp. CFBP 13605]MBD8141686.1 hypothetical protein [Frigoribacterium sp. CFBP 13605]